MDDEDFFNAMEKNWYNISWNSAVLFLAFPIIKWSFWSLIYFFNQSEWVLNKFTLATFDKIIPWYFEIFINFKGSLVVFALSFLIIWIIYSIKESYKE